MRRLAAWLLRRALLPYLPARRRRWRPDQWSAGARVRPRLDAVEARDMTGNLVNGLVAAAFGGPLMEPIERMAAAVGDLAMLGRPVEPPPATFTVPPPAAAGPAAGADTAAGGGGGTSAGEGHAAAVGEWLVAGLWAPEPAEPAEWTDLTPTGATSGVDGGVDSLPAVPLPAGGGGEFPAPPAPGTPPGGPPPGGDPLLEPSAAPLPGPTATRAAAGAEAGEPTGP